MKQTSAQIVAANCAAPLAFEDQESAEEALQTLSVESRVVFACVFDKEGKQFAQYARHDRKSATVVFPGADNQSEFSRRILTINRKIEHGDQFKGTVFVQADLKEMYARLYRAIGDVSLIGIATLAVAFLCAFVLQRGVSGPIERLAKVMTSISTESDYSLRGDREADNELGSLVDGFNAMLTHIEERDTMLEQSQEQLEQREL